MRGLALLWTAALASGFASGAAHASAMDGTNCLSTAERVDAGEVLTSDEIEQAHQACIRALAATGSVLQKYQFQEADFAITGKHHKF